MLHAIPCMVCVGMGDQGTAYFSPWVNVHISLCAIDTIAVKFKEGMSTDRMHSLKVDSEHRQAKEVV